MTEHEFSKLRPGERVYVGGTFPPKKFRGTVLLNREGEVLVQWDRSEEKFPNRICIPERQCRGYQVLVPKGER